MVLEITIIVFKLKEGYSYRIYGKKVSFIKDRYN